MLLLKGPKFDVRGQIVINDDIETKQKISRASLGPSGAKNLYKQLELKSQGMTSVCLTQRNRKESDIVPDFMAVVSKTIRNDNTSCGNVFYFQSLRILCVM